MSELGCCTTEKKLMSQSVAAKRAWYNIIIRVLSIMPSKQLKLCPYISVTTICRLLTPF